MRPHEIYNRASLVTDHTTYWENADEFVTTVFCAINKLADLGFADLTEDLLQHAKARRKWRVLCLAFLRNLVIACCPVILWAGRNNFAAIGEAVATWFIAAREWLTTALGTLPGTGAIRDTVSGYATAQLPTKVLGGASLLLLPLGWYLTVILILRAWEATDVQRVFRGEVRTSKEHDFGGVSFILLFIWTAVLVLATFMSVVASYNRSVLDLLNRVRLQGGPIIVELILISVASAMLIKVFQKWFASTSIPGTAGRVFILAAPIDTWLHLQSPYMLVSVLCIEIAGLVGAIWLYDHFIGPRLGDWLTRTSLAVSAESKPSNANEEKFQTHAGSTRRYALALIAVVMGSVAVFITRLPLAQWQQWEQDLVPCLIWPWVGFGVFVASEALDKGENPRLLKAIAFSGIGLLILSCMLLFFWISKPS